MVERILLDMMCKTVLRFYLRGRHEIGGREENVTSCFWTELFPVYKILFSSSTKGVMFVYVLLSKISFTKFDRRSSCCRINNNSLVLRKNL